MKIRFLNKSIEHRRFSYIPMYYDEDQERLEGRKAHFRQLQGEKLDPEKRRDILRQSMRQEFNRMEHRRSQFRASNIRVLLLVGLLVALGYFFLFGVDHVDSVMKKLF